MQSRVGNSRIRVIIAERDLTALTNSLRFFLSPPPFFSLFLLISRETAIFADVTATFDNDRPTFVRNFARNLEENERFCLEKRSRTSRIEKPPAKRLTCLAYCLA